MDTATSPRSTTMRDTRVQPAWPWDWENRPTKDQCDHLWEIVVMERLFNPREKVARCVDCHTPRCGYAEDPRPCQLRRHHAGEHQPSLAG